MAVSGSDDSDPGTGFCCFEPPAIPLASVQPASAEDHSQSQKDGQSGPGDAVESRFRTAGARERCASAGGKPSHSIALGTVQKNKQDE